jgi:3-oxoadipate enol-lactonase
MGGLIGQELALRHPDKVKALVLANTTQAYTPAGREAIAQRIATIDAHGLSAISTSTMHRFFSEDFRTHQAAAVSRHQRLLEATDPEGYTACAAAICEADFSGQLHKVRVPSLVISGSADESLPPDTAIALARALSGAQLVTLQGCAHLSAVEQPQAFTEVLAEFIAGL